MGRRRRRQHTAPPAAVGERLALTASMFEEAAEGLRAVIEPGNQGATTMSTPYDGPGQYPEPAAAHETGGLPPGPPRQATAVYLADRLDRMIGESQRLRTDVAASEARRAREEARRRQQNLAIFGVLAMLAALVVVLIFVVVLQLGRQVRDSSAVVQDCLNPQGQCAQRNAARQDEALEEVRRTQIYSIECAREVASTTAPVDGNDGFNRRFEACVAARLAAARQPGWRDPAVPSPGASPTPSPTLTPTPAPTSTPSVPGTAPASPGPVRSPAP